MSIIEYQMPLVVWRKEPHTWLATLQPQLTTCRVVADTSIDPARSSLASFHSRFTPQTVGLIVSPS